MLLVRMRLVLCLFVCLFVCLFELVCLSLFVCLFVLQAIWVIGCCEGEVRT